MRDIVDAIADSIEAEVAAAGTIQRHSPIWRNPEDGSVLYIYGVRRSPAGPRTTGYREDAYEIAVEMVETANQLDLVRDQEAELEFQEKADALVTWADAHSEGFTDVAHSMDFVGLAYQDDLRRELMVRYARMTLVARKFTAYT